MGDHQNSTPAKHPVSFTWSVDTTVGQAVNIGSNILRVCTSDNVQPLALLACEKFGAQLAMCQETRIKMEQLGRRHCHSYVLKALAISIGYMVGDTADYFASSDAGGTYSPVSLHCQL